ncbi:MAG: tetrameric acyl-CoA thioesterase [Anaerolineae bacterium]|nr:MAG: tetrameric acyl-CoA thioesterase [Anaerolineae bacterium]
MTRWQRLREYFINLYPPFLGAGIRSRRLDELTIQVQMPLTWWNRNIFGTHFGGSLYAMCDPWFALILLRALGKEYIVWDKAASIQFLKPGRGTVKATFHIPPQQVEQIRQQAEKQAKVEPFFTVDVFDTSGNVIARVEKLLYVRKKQ